MPAAPAGETKQAAWCSAYRGTFVALSVNKSLCPHLQAQTPPAEGPRTEKACCMCTWGLQNVKCTLCLGWPQLLKAAVTGSRTAAVKSRVSQSAALFPLLICTLPSSFSLRLLSVHINTRTCYLRQQPDFLHSEIMTPQMGNYPKLQLEPSCSLPSPSKQRPHNSASTLPQKTRTGKLWTGVA